MKNQKLKFVWNDGGRAASGFVGCAGDCVARAIAIATGKPYREVYGGLGEIAGESARNGVIQHFTQQYLQSLGWLRSEYEGELPEGVLIVRFETERSGHLACVIDGEIHDTWDPFEDHVPVEFYRHRGTDGTHPTLAPRRISEADPGDMTHDQYTKILHRIRELRRTAGNDASTEGEIRNAVRMAQTLMLKHNLSEADLTEQEQVNGSEMTRRRCYLNGKRACRWESRLANYVTTTVVPTVQHYFDRQAKRTAYFFYGPRDDVDYAIDLFKELLVTIATSARLNYGGYARGSGASYAKGYVDGLPRFDPETIDTKGQEMIRARMLSIHKEAKHWLEMECGISLCTKSGSSSGLHDPTAYAAGQRDGSTHSVSGRSGVKRIADLR